ncbi:hypothetical protein [Komagataeibacter oboediens]|nr:hypothetical protein [Komagataeibacter oboediens]
MNETPMYLVPGRLTDEQETNMRSELLGGPILDAADMFVRMMGIVGTPIQPCADVETVGFVPDKSNLFVDKRLPMTNIYRSAGDPWPVPLVRRTDMEAQVARVAAKKDAEIERLRRALSRVGDALAYEINEHSIVDTVWISPIETMDDFIEAALTEGSAE